MFTTKQIQLIQDATAQLGLVHPLQHPISQTQLIQSSENDPLEGNGTQKNSFLFLLGIWFWNLLLESIAKVPVKRVSDKVVDKSIVDCEFWQVHVSSLLIIITFGLHALGNNPYTYSTTQVNFGSELFIVSGQQQQLGTLCERTNLSPKNSHSWTIKTNSPQNGP